MIVWSFLWRFALAGLVLVYVGVRGISTLIVQGGGTHELAYNVAPFVAVAALVVAGLLASASARK